MWGIRILYDGERNDVGGYCKKNSSRITFDRLRGIDAHRQLGVWT